MFGWSWGTQREWYSSDLYLYWDLFPRYAQFTRWRVYVPRTHARTRQGLCDTDWSSFATSTLFEVTYKTGNNGHACLISSFEEPNTMIHCSSWSLHRLSWVTSTKKYYVFFYYYFRLKDPFKESLKTQGCYKDRF